MSTATTSRKERGSRRPRRRILARDVANTYWIYINPDSSELERQAHPLVEAWYQEGTMKEHILQAIIQYTDKNITEESRLEYEIDRLRVIVEDFIKIGNNNSSGIQMIESQDDGDEMSSEELEFLSDFLDFGE